MNENSWYGKDGGFYKDIFEKRAADTKYEQQEAIKRELRRQNELAERAQRNAEKMLEETRRNAELIAESNIQAEEDRHNNEMLLEEERHKNNLMLEAKKRATKLCDDIGVDYEELVYFYFALEHYGDRKIVKDIEKIYIDKINVFFDIISSIENQKEEIKNIKKELEKKQKEYNINKRKKHRLVEDLQEQTKKHNNIFKFFKSAKTILEEENELKNLQNDVNKTENELNSIKDKFNELNRRLDTLLVEEDGLFKLTISPQLKENIGKYHKLKAKVNELCLENKDFINSRILFKKFKEFRINHYNQDIELLFRKLKFEFDYISEEEVKNIGTINDYLSYIGEIVYDKDKELLLKYGNDYDEYAEDNEDDEDDYYNYIDPLLEEAVESVIEIGQATTSFIQRRFKVGYARAGRIIDQMESRGIISDWDGSNPREVLITKEDFEEKWRYVLNAMKFKAVDVITGMLYLSVDEVKEIIINK